MSDVAGAINGGELPSGAVKDRVFEVAVGDVVVADGGLAIGGEGERSVDSDAAGAIDGGELPGGTVEDRVFEVDVGGVVVADGGLAIGGEGQ